jgi:hypothetical protein
MALISIIVALVGGQSLGAILAGLSLMQWIEVAGTLISAEPTLVKAFSELHPAFDIIAKALKSGVSPGAAGSQAYASLGPHYHGGPKSNI